MPRSAELMTGKADEFSKDPTTNTIKLRKKFTEFVIQEQVAGNPTPSFHEWAKKNYPDVPILGPG
jgi:hypothetical protein